MDNSIKINQDNIISATVQSQIAYLTLIDINCDSVNSLNAG